MFIGRTDVEVETPVLWPPDAKSWLIWKDPDAGKDWGQEEKGMTEDEMVGWHHRLNGHGFGWTPGVGDGQGGLACCSGVAKSRTRLSDWTELNSLVGYLYPGAGGSLPLKPLIISWKLLKSILFKNFWKDDVKYQSGLFWERKIPTIPSHNGLYCYSFIPDDTFLYTVFPWS